MNALSLNLILEIAANFVGPWAMFELMDKSYGDTNALIGSALPPLVWSAIELVRTRRFDAVSAVVLTGIVLTFAATLLGGSAKLLQIRENAVTGLIGVAFLLSLCSERPLIYHLARATFARRSPDSRLQLETFSARPQGAAFFRRLTIAWGIGLIGQTVILVWLAFAWPIGRYLLLSPIVGYGLLGLLSAGTLWYRRHLRII